MNTEPRAFPLRRTCPFDLAEDYAQLRRSEPVAPVTLQRTGATAWLLTRHDDVRTVLTDDERFGQGFSNSGGGQATTSFGMAIADPVVHRGWRRVVNKVFSVRQAEAARPRIAAVVESTVDELEQAGQPADLMAGFAFRVS